MKSQAMRLTILVVRQQHQLSRVSIAKEMGMIHLRTHEFLLGVYVFISISLIELVYPLPVQHSLDFFRKYF
jgi:hypothetical protein